MAALNGGLGSGGLSNGTGSTMEALSQAYSGIQQYAAAALPTLYNQSLLTQQSIGAAGSQKEGKRKTIVERIVHEWLNCRIATYVVTHRALSYVTVEAMDKKSVN